MQQDGRWQLPGAVLEETEHQRREEHQRRPERTVGHKVHRREHNAGQQIGHREWSNRALTDVFVYQFLQQATKNHFLDQRIKHHRQQKLPGF